MTDKDGEKITDGTWTIKSDSTVTAVDYINSAVAKGYVDGYTDGTFKPAQSVTRAEAAKIMNLVLGWSDKAAASTAQYTDLTEAHWAYETITKSTTGVTE